MRNYTAKINAIDLQDFQLDQSFAIFPTISSDYFQHAQYAALRTKDAIADRFRADTGGRRPPVEKDNPDFRIYLHIVGDRYAAARQFGRIAAQAWLPHRSQRSPLERSISRRD